MEKVMKFVLSIVLVAVLGIITGCATHQVTENATRNDLEPPEAERVYVYDAGYPPGCYYFGGFWWYEHRHYTQRRFQTTIVNQNIQNNMYMDVRQNQVTVNQIKVHQTASRLTGALSKAPTAIKGNAQPSVSSKTTSQAGATTFKRPNSGPAGSAPSSPRPTHRPSPPPKQTTPRTY